MDEKARTAVPSSTDFTLMVRPLRMQMPPAPLVVRNELPFPVARIDTVSGVTRVTETKSIPKRLSTGMSVGSDTAIWHVPSKQACTSESPAFRRAAAAPDEAESGAFGDSIDFLDEGERDPAEAEFDAPAVSQSPFRPSEPEACHPQPTTPAKLNAATTVAAPTARRRPAVLRSGPVPAAAHASAAAAFMVSVLNDQPAISYTIPYIPCAAGRPRPSPARTCVTGEPRRGPGADGAP
ncbi:hypothetical protein ABT009_39380 [Streptomyces sp. NPDC002896]|uniref:hypothetical protein n=1 Tax=Streptomyces sp. NPDC002896 TaxID=3154438 RepID=UPI00333476B3